jgi:hypothetical protein
MKTEVMVCSKYPENIRIKMEDNALKQVPNFRYLRCIFTEDGENKEDTIQRVKEAKIMSNNKTQLICSNHLGLEIKKETYKKLKLECCSLWIRNIDSRKK